MPQDGRIKAQPVQDAARSTSASAPADPVRRKGRLRILDGGKLGIDKLGEEDQKALFLDAYQKPYGMVLVTGPTGSGKTVSLYTALNILNEEERNISTVEDPVEIRVPGINQCR